jgi:hypothetical protein
MSSFEIPPGKEIYRWMLREPLRLSRQNNFIGLKPYDRALTSATFFCQEVLGVSNRGTFLEFLLVVLAAVLARLDRCSAEYSRSLT